MNCIIIDDEPLAAEGLAGLIGQNPMLTLKQVFYGTQGVREYIEKENVDLIFLDIEMPDETGLEFAKHVAEHTLIIFTTAYPQYALDSYEVEAIDYLLKPISKERFSRAVQRGQQYHDLLKESKTDVDQVQEDYLLIRADRRFIKVQFSDILFISSLKDYVIIHTTTTRIITWMNLKTIHSKLPAHRFIRVSKSYVVNKEQITNFDNNKIYIQDQDIPIGKAYQSDFFSLYFH